VCQKGRHRKACLAWNKKHPGHDHSRRVKTQAWAKVFPDYWQRYRATHPDYAERERKRMRAKRGKIRRVAKQDAWDRRVDGVLDYLIWKEGVANQDALAWSPSGA